MIERHIWRIIHESAGILIVASVISTFGGIGLEALRSKLALLMPIIILLPGLNDMIGDFGAIIASRFTLMLYQKEIQEKQWWREHKIHHLFFVILGIAVLAAIYVAGLAYLIAMAKGFPFDLLLIEKVVFVSVLATIFLICVLFFVSIVGGFYVYRRKHDPDNYLIPLATAIADFGSMLVLSGLLMWLF
jgi:cation transporter-like permease